MKYLILIITAYMLSGCGALERMYTRYTGDLTYKCSKTGVEYVQSDSGLAVLLDGQGSPVVCK